MPKYKNSFSEPEFYEHAIVSESGGVVGVLRVKPSSLLWKPSGRHRYFSVPLETFSEWIQDHGKKASK